MRIVVEDLIRLSVLVLPIGLYFVEGVCPMSNARIRKKKAKQKRLFEEALKELFEHTAKFCNEVYDIDPKETPYFKFFVGSTDV